MQMQKYKKNVLRPNIIGFFFLNDIQNEEKSL